MSKAESRFKDKLISLLKTKTIDQISVGLLCQELGYNRQTFYYHYRDIYDLVQSILLSEEIGRNNSDSIEEIIKNSIEYANKNYSFLNGLIRSHLDDLIEEMYYSYFYKQFHTLLSKFDYIKSDKNNKDVKRYLANLFAKEVTFWLINKCSENIESFSNRLLAISKYFLQNYENDLEGGKQND